MEGLHEQVSRSGIFKNRFGKVRSGWKVALMWVLFLVLSALLEIPIMAVYGLNFDQNLIGNDLAEFAQELCEIGAVLFMVYVVERDRLKNFGFPRDRAYAREVLYGVLWGIGSMIAIFLLLWMSGNVTLKYSLAQSHWSANLAWMLVIMVLVGFGEEMMSRGYIMTVIQRQTGKRWLAIGVSSLIFAAMHLANPHVSVFGFINLFLFALVAACMYIRSGSLWMPIAFHASWDYFEGNVFGFPNSGTTSTSLFQLADVKSNFLTGGGFGPEGGILSTVVLLLVFVWLWKGYKPKRIT